MGDGDGEESAPRRPARHRWLKPMTAAASPHPTALAGKIARMIEADGPMSVAHFMSLCLSDPQFGYYQTREPFGTKGDFVTAPEVTQLFGEMVAIFLVHGWQAAGRPLPVRLAEVGPGRGTLMKDMLRTIARLAPDLHAGASVHLVETSRRLVDIQARTLKHVDRPCRWHEDLTQLPEGHLLLVANELFDALPIRQFVKAGATFRERVVAREANGALSFAVGPGRIDPAMLPADAAGQDDGTIFEAAPAREAMAQAIAERLVAQGGLALVIDYGHIVSGYGDTLQALWSGGFDAPLAHPGEADITSHVDFEVLATRFRQSGAHVAGMCRQGDFLLGLGLLERAGRLGTGRSPDEQDAIRAAVERIAGEGAGRMGELFKVLAVTGAPLALQPFTPSGRGRAFP